MDINSALNGSSGHFNFHRSHHKPIHKELHHQSRAWREGKHEIGLLTFCGCSGGKHTPIWPYDFQRNVSRKVLAKQEFLEMGRAFWVSMHWLLKSINSIFLFKKSSLLIDRIQETDKIAYSVSIIQGRENWNSQKSANKYWSTLVKGKVFDLEKFLRENLWFPARLFIPVAKHN